MPGLPKTPSALGTFSPPLDDAGNSVRGARAIIDIVGATNSNPYAQLG
jgi:glutaminase